MVRNGPCQVAPSDNKKVAACAHVVRSGERGTEAAPATSGRYPKCAPELEERQIRH